MPAITGFKKRPFIDLDSSSERTILSKSAKQISMPFLTFKNPKKLFLLDVFFIYLFIFPKLFVFKTRGENAATLNFSLPAMPFKTNVFCTRTPFAVCGP